MKNFINLGKKLFPICRSLTGKGTLDTLKILRKENPKLNIKNFKSGTKVFDWKVPHEWNIKDAFVEDKYGKKIINFKNNNLHLVGYSKPCDFYVDKKKLLKHIFSLKNLPSAIPYITSYYKKYWGFCTTHKQKLKIIKKYKSNDKFKVKIKSSFNKNGNMNYGEILLKGRSKDEVLISSYICHPSMANNELSGPLVALALSKYFINTKRDKTIRILFIPETIGSIAYINKNLNNLKKNVIGGFNLTCLGDEKCYSYIETKYGNTASDFAIIKAYKDLNIKFKKYSYLKRGSDERQYNSPGVDLNIATIMRSKFGTFKEYQTSLDNFNLVTERGLKQSFKLTKEAIKNLMKEKNILKKNKKNNFSKNNPYAKMICEPQLGKRGLYPLVGSRGAKKRSVRDILDFLQFADGNNNLFEIAKFMKCSLKKAMKIHRILKKEKLLRTI